MPTDAPDPLLSLPGQPSINETLSVVNFRYWLMRSARFSAAVFLVLVIYCYPALRTRFELRSTTLPPTFAPDLSLYVNLSGPSSTGRCQFLNPYYLVPVPFNGSGYLQFRLGPTLFGKLHTALAGRLWVSMFLWNALWWALLSISVLSLLIRFLPGRSSRFIVLGFMLLMLSNFGVLKTLIAAWTRLPSMAGFENIGLPYMRAFVPVIPVALLVAYLGLQMEVSRRRNAILLWVALGVLQFVALASFPYATLIMAGITAAGAAWRILSSGSRRIVLVVATYGLACAATDILFATRGSLGFYSSHSSLIQFQLTLLSHLIGGNWLILAFLTVLAVFNKRLSPDVKWPLVGMGGSNLLLMLGDAVIPAKTILLSHHAGHFIHTSIVILLIFLLAEIFARPDLKSGQWDFRQRILVACLIVGVALNGVLLSVGTYRGFLSYNKDQAEIAKELTGPFRPDKGDLVIARSRNVDDYCSWVFVLTQGPVLYCTDAEVMLTPQQNIDIHRFRQAIYLYLTGQDIQSLRRMLAGPDGRDLMFQLGYWAEAASPSPAEQADGMRAIESELIAPLERIEQGNLSLSNFFRRFRRIVVVDNVQTPTFSQDRLASFLKLEDEQRDARLRFQVYTAR